MSGIAPTSEIVWLDGERDGIEQVSAALAERRDVDAIHFLTHGNERLVKLGGTWLSPETVGGYAEQIAGWSLALADGADLLFYACDLGGSVVGQGVLETLHTLTGADIAASTNDTGHAQYGADWNLEFQLGMIETGGAINAAVQESWGGLLATFTVINTNPSGAGSLAQAVANANASVGTTDTITFNIPGEGLKTILVAGTLDITDPVIIDGYTQPLSFVNNLSVGDNAVINIELNGQNVFPEGAPSGLNITAGGSTIKGLIINRFPGAGIVLSGGDNNLISGNFIGTDASGTVDLGNGGAGILIAGSSIGNTIGGSSPSARNLISGNNQQGIDVAGGTSGNVIRGNYIGTNKGGTAALANSFEGVRVIGASNNNIIGGSGAGDRNVISGNLTDGVRINGSTGNLIRGNYIGTTAAGTAALGNTNYGVLLQGGASGNTIGGLTSTPGTGAGNVLSGNGIDGVAMEHSGTANNQVQGNVIGLNAAGTASLGIQDFGVVLVDGPTNNTIGGTAVGARNIISGNEFDGVLIVRNTTAVSGNVVEGNYIGTDLGGTLDVGNGRDGVLLFGGVTGNRIGGTAAASRNVIAGNNQEGVQIESVTSTGNLVQGNYIGTNAAGTGAVGNSGMGVLVLTATGNTIGGASAGARNIISGNAGQGVLLTGGASSNAVQGNYIGTNAAGTGFLSNGFDGVVLSNAANNTIGGTTAGERNIISGNNSYGVTLADSGTTGNVVSGNYIGTNAAGTGAVGNGLGGVRVSLGASANTIQSNRLAFNGQDGVSVESGTGNRIQTNEIFSNGGLGIDLSDNSVTANDAGDGDSGPNRLQNYPVLSSAVVNGTQVTIQGTLNSTANSSFVVEFFASPAADPSGFGEGQTFLGSATVNTNGSGNATINSTFTASGVSGQFISATATNLTTNDTSEFAQNIVANPPQSPVLDLDANNSSGQSGANYAATWTEDGGAVPVADPADATLTDADSATLSSLTVTLTTRPDGAVESLDANVAGTGITKTAYNSGTGVLLLSGSASIAQYQQVLRTVTYNNTSQAPTTTARSITFVASDGANSSNTATTTLTIVAGNDAPVNTVPGAQTTNEDQARVFSSGNSNLISISDVDVGTNPVQVTLTGTNGTITLNGTSGLSFTVGDGTNDATMTFTGTIATINARLDGLSFLPTANFNGTATLQIATNDQGNSGTGGAKSDSDNVTITVNAVNDAPSFTKGADQTVNEDAGAQTVANWATNLSRGPADENGQTLTFLIQGNTNPGLFAVGPAISATGTLTYTPAANANGSATITVALQDTGGTANGGQNTSAGQSFVVTVNPVNDPPVLTNNGGGATASLSIPENSTAVTTLTSTDVDGGAPVYSLVGGADVTRFTINASTGVLTFLTPPDFEAPTDADVNNIYEVTVQVSDGAGGVDQQALSVTATNVANTLTVTTTADGVDGVTSSIETLNANPGADGRISLREAILAANATLNGTTPDLILFNILGTGVRTIQPTTALPTLTDPVIIDGTTQPGYAGTPLIELNGQSAGANNVSGLMLTAGGSTLRGLAINRFSGAGVLIQGQDRNVLEGNVIGASPDALSGLGNGGPGVRIVDSADNTVGGLVPGTGNIFSGNSGAGLELVGTLTTGTQVWGNFIGTNATGASGIPNGGAGVLVRGAINTTIGHPTNPAGMNRIAFNVGAGVAIENGTQNRIQGNAMVGNGGPAIDLNNDGVTPNDASDADSGANKLQNTPTLTSAWLDGTVLKGTLTSTPNRTFSVEFARQTDGQLLGRRAVTTDVNGAATFELNLDSPVALGDLVTATATDVSGNTSEYAPSILVTADGVATFPLAIRTNGTGQGSVRTLPAGIDLTAGDATERYPKNTLVTLEAQPKPGFVFAGWSGFGVRETSPFLTVPIQRARIYTATFVPEHSTETVPPPVRFLTAKSHWASTVTLGWERLQLPPGVTLLGYNIYREDPSGNLQLIQQVGSDVTSTTLTNIDQYESSTLAITGVTTRPDDPNASMETGFSNAVAAAPGSGLEGWSVLDEGTDPPPTPARSRWQTVVIPTSGAGQPGVFYEQLSLIGSPADQTAFRRGTSLFRTDGINQGKTNFTIEMGLQSLDSGALGVLFRYVNTRNYYRLSMEQDPNRDGELSDAYVRLIKVEGGVPSVVREALGPDAAYVLGERYGVTIEAITPQLTVRIIDSVGRSLIGGEWTVTDETFTSNGIGLYSSRNPGSIFSLVAFEQDNPDPRIVDLQVDVTGMGQGRVKSSVDGFVASLDTQGAPATQFDRGTRVTLTATPDPGYGFGGWYDLNGNQISSDPNNQNKLTLTVDEARVIEARFTGIPPPSHKLDINGDGQSTAAVDGQLAVRYLAGAPDSQLMPGGLSTQATPPLRASAASVRSYLDTSGLTLMDVDGDGVLSPFTDGRLVYRFLNETTDADLLKGQVLSLTAQRLTPGTIRTFLAPYHPEYENVAPVLTARLQQDTGVSATDGLTGDPTVQGTVEDAHAMTTFRAGLDGAAPAQFVDVFGTLTAVPAAPGITAPRAYTFTLDRSRLEQIQGGPLADGAHTLRLLAGDLFGNTIMGSIPFTLDATVPALTVTAPVESENLTAQSRLAGQVIDANRPTSLTYQFANSPSPFIVPLAAIDGTFDTLLNQQGLTPGPTSVTVTVTDRAGNTSTVTRSVTIPVTTKSSDAGLNEGAPAVSPQSGSSGLAASSALSTSPVVPMGFAGLTLQSAALADGSDDQPLLSSSPAWLGDFAVSSAILTEEPNRDLVVMV